MPTSPNVDQITIKSRDLIKRLQSSGRNRKGQLSNELRQEMLTAMTELTELVTHLAASADQPTKATEQPTEAEPATSTESTFALVTGNHWQGLTEQLEDLVARAVSKSLADWQASSLPTESSSIANHPKGSTELQVLIDELEIELSDVRKQLFSASDELSETKAQLKTCQQELAEAEAKMVERPWNVDSNPQDTATPTEEGLDWLREATANQAAQEHAQIAEQLQQQLNELLSEVAILREQNGDLAAQLAQRVATAATNSNGKRTNDQLTWEERKLLILKQLEGDSGTSDSSIDIENGLNPELDIQEILHSTEQEIAKRDEQIEELREIVRMQSEARDGLAIGAAGLASLLDSDELVQQERQKLRDIQLEWEAKLRQAEIDLSLERAKIARERIALERQQEELRACTQRSSGEVKEKSRERRWLNILGLGEESPDKSKG